MDVETRWVDIRRHCYVLMLLSSTISGVIRVPAKSHGDIRNSMMLESPFKRDSRTVKGLSELHLQ